jgi:hypothetical protein
LFLKIVLRINLDLIAAFYSIYKNKNSGDFFAILRALKDFLVAIPTLQKKRKAIPHPSSVHLSNINILWQHFAKGISKFKDLPL